ncbi:hypothetical protein RJ639_028446 [Escallonia herrerae]|uniref:CCHC-type domain-containing protein n=1 Tax=Escallonia herrerae TaxID=1293975 RepID=A0AA88X602_9ASTE|nr:hypothetical protein RJ639_028446 [Escallonia herrerae]
MVKTVKKLKSVKSVLENDEQEEEIKQVKPSISYDDDDEANEDLSLKIVQKAMLRSCSTSASDAVPGQSQAEAVPDLKDDKKKKKVKIVKRIVRRIVKKKEVKTQDDAVDAAKEIDESLASNPVEKSDNVVLRKLLRGPRYFDPPDSSWGVCFNCGEEGHMAVNCTSARRKKPCFVCGSLEHNVRQCTKVYKSLGQFSYRQLPIQLIHENLNCWYGFARLLLIYFSLLDCFDMRSSLQGQDCFICKKGGHRAKDCPDKYAARSPSANICLKCGHSGHEMFSCNSDYSLDDLKEIQCYICKGFGHLCCFNHTASGPTEVSCYRCGQSGHTGLVCITLSCVFLNACASISGESPSMGSVSSCYRCGEAGHFARECTSSAASVKLFQKAKRSQGFSTPKQRKSKENRDLSEVRAVSHDPGKARKRKNNQYEEDFFTSPSKSKHRGGWITEDPGDFTPRKAEWNGWRSPATPSYQTKFSAGGHASSSYSSKTASKFHYGHSSANGSANFYQHRFPASRFGNSSSGGIRRNYDW